MSAEDDGVGQDELESVVEAAVEPGYLSEIARRLRKAEVPFELNDLGNVERTWGDLTHQFSLSRVANIFARDDSGSFHLLEDDNFEVRFVTYDEGAGQKEASPHATVQDIPNDEWGDYVIIHNVETSPGDIDNDELLDVIDPTTTIEEKVDEARLLSRVGNEMAELTEVVMQDVLQRQFREYEIVEYPDYNDPDVDFFVVDTDRRDYGLVVEISSRFVNPVDDHYVTTKLDSAQKKEQDHDIAVDLLILAPRFTGEGRESGVWDTFENEEDPAWHEEPENQVVHMHRVPDEKPSVYRPFAKSPPEEDRLERGNPVVVPDGEQTRSRIRNTGHVGNDYPVFDSDYGDFREALGNVHRQYRIISESRYRNQIREAIEPLLWEFMRPYRIEQFLIDTYWNKQLSQSEIGELVDRSASTIGRWMREDKWGIIRRGTGAPELTDETIEIWSRMYEGEPPFPREFSGYRIQAEWNRHPQWSLEDWEEWYQETSPSERRQTVGMQESYSEELDYTILVGADQRLLPSYNFVITTLRENGVEIRPPDEAPRVPYEAYPSRDELEYMINRQVHTVESTVEEPEES